jgi:hypothetical protein
MMRRMTMKRAKLVFPAESHLEEDLELELVSQEEFDREEGMYHGIVRRMLARLAQWGYVAGGSDMIDALVEQGWAERADDAPSSEYAELTPAARVELAARGFEIPMREFDA